METRNGEQLRRGDAHIATKAGVAGHPSLSLYRIERRGRIAATAAVAARTPVYRSRGASLEGERYDRRLASMNECPDL